MPARQWRSSAAGWRNIFRDGLRASPAWIVLLLGLAFTLWAWQIAHESRHTQQQAHFQHQVEQLRQALRERRMRWEQTLYGVQGLYIASDRIDAREWEIFTRNLRIEQYTPSMRGLGIVVLDAPPRAGDANDAETIHEPSSPDRDERMMIQLLEPGTVAAAAIGFDLATDPEAQQALRQAASTGQIVMSAPLGAARQVLGGADRLICLPLHHGPSAAGEGAMPGSKPGAWVVAAVSSDLVLNWARQGASSQLALEAFEGLEPLESRRIYRTPTGPDQGACLPLVQSMTFSFGGQEWLLRCSNSTAETSAQHWGPLLVALAGLSASLLLFGFVWSLGRTNDRAQALARQMTASLRASEAQTRKLALVARSTDNAVVIADAQGRIEWVNDAFTRMTGYKLDQVQGQKPGAFLQGPDSDPAAIRHMHDQLARGQGFHIEIINYDRHGRPHWTSIGVEPVYDGQGQLTHFIGLKTDITQRKQAEETLRRSQQFLQCTLDAMPVHVAILNERGLIVAVNEAWRRFARDNQLTDPSCGIGQDYVALCDHVLDAQPIAQGLRDVIARRRDTFEFEYPCHSPGQQRWFCLSATRFEVGGSVRVIVSHENITQRVQTLDALRESEQRYALAAQGANDGLWDWDLRTDRLYLSPRWKQMLGCENEEMAPGLTAWLDRVHEQDLSLVKASLQAHLDGNTAHFESEHRIRHNDGSHRWVLSRGLAVRDQEGLAYRIAGSQTDITDRKAAEERLRHDAYHDALTGLPNRNLFIDRLQRCLRRRRRVHDYRFAVLFLDLDRFKVINDSLGHLAGDRLLLTIAQTLQRCLRETDTVSRFEAQHTIARLGGDEFTILLDDLHSDTDASRVADRLLKELCRPFLVDGREVFITASIGIALSEGGYDRAEDLLRDADTALYRAKAMGKARHEVFDHQMHQRAMLRLQLESDLRNALKRGELEVYYQPLVHLRTHQLMGFEALLRWNHPQRGRIGPGDFIPIAEETGLIVPVGQWVLEQACRQLRQWQQQALPTGGLYISVNLSNVQLRQSDLVERFRQILQEQQIDPAQLRLEITESVVADEEQSTVERLYGLRDIGLQLFMDDFGTGYSSLSALHRLPIQAVKIDRSFVSRLGVAGEQTQVIGAVVTLAHSLGMQVIAEGIETAEQLARLRELRCGGGQGFFFAKPMPADEASRFLQSQAVAKSA